MRIILDDVKKAVIKDHRPLTVIKPYPASHYDGEFPDAFKGEIEPPTRKLRIREILKLIIVVILALTIIKVSWAILLHIFPHLSQYISL